VNITPLIGPIRFSGAERVDLYAYISAVVALTQEQQKEIDRLKTEIDLLKKRQD
jgi:hypothetical protein